MGAEFGFFGVFLNANFNKRHTRFLCKYQNRGGRRFSVRARLEWVEDGLRHILAEFGTDSRIQVRSESGGFGRFFNFSQILG